MTYQRLAYDDQDTTVKMHTDCDACASEMGIPEELALLEALGSAPTAERAGQPQETRTPRIEVSDSAARLASEMQLHY